jgi:hypothetical protein
MGPFSSSSAAIPGENLHSLRSDVMLRRAEGDEGVSSEVYDHFVPDCLKSLGDDDSQSDGSEGGENETESGVLPPTAGDAGLPLCSHALQAAYWSEYQPDMAMQGVPSVEVALEGFHSESLARLHSRRRRARRASSTGTSERVDVGREAEHDRGVPLAVIADTDRWLCRVVRVKWDSEDELEEMMTVPADLVSNMLHTLLALWEGGMEEGHCLQFIEERLALLAYQASAVWHDGFVGTMLCA